MSLFGSSPTQPPLAHSSLNSKSLFGDEVTPAATSTSSLFADENSDPSPWSMPTPKKAARRDLVKTLLQATDVPESYVDAYDKTLASGDRVGAGIGLTEIKKILESSGLSPTVQAQVLNLVLPGGQETVSGLGRSEFNVLLALIGLGQEDEDPTLDGVDERRRRESFPPSTSRRYVLSGCCRTSYTKNPVSRQGRIRSLRRTIQLYNLARA
jgi:sorting nexin-8